MRTQLAFILALIPSNVSAQSALEHHSWEDPYPLLPLSRTAEAVTGPVRVTGRAISFNGKSVPARLEGIFWRAWGIDGENHTASVYRLISDPGKLRQGNTLCGGADKARYAVFWESYSDLTGGAVNMAVWSSEAAPRDKDSRGLCGTFSYDWQVRRVNSN